MSDEHENDQHLELAAGWPRRLTITVEVDLDGRRFHPVYAEQAAREAERAVGSYLRHPSVGFDTTVQTWVSYGYIGIDRRLTVVE